MRRAAFITLVFQNDADGGDNPPPREFQQLNVKAWLMRRIQIALIPRYAELFEQPRRARSGNRQKKLKHQNLF
jgi:hypothetical protein